MPTCTLKHVHHSRCSFNDVLTHSHVCAANFTGETWVWFGIRSDGRCGRDFLTEWGHETGCGKGHCCSSHGWCGDGEDYCTVSMGCQNGCWPASKQEEAKHAADTGGHGEGAPDDDEYMDRMNHYRYDEDHHDHDYYHRRYGGYGRDRGDNHDYHHHYDAEEYGREHGDYPHHDPHEEYGGGDHHHGDPDYDEHHGDDHGDDHDYQHDGSHYDHDDEMSARERHTREHEEERRQGGGAPPEDHDPRDRRTAEGGGGGGEDDGPELVGLEEKRHLGEGDGVPLHGEKPGVEAAAAAGKPWGGQHHGQQ